MAGSTDPRRRSHAYLLLIFVGGRWWGISRRLVLLVSGLMALLGVVSVGTWLMLQSGWGVGVSGLTTLVYHGLVFALVFRLRALS
ncbi:MAG: hypothetical protein R3200_09580 [Xanthomonadales bacterium]|nr:hypothetical protein [Xanthomonadales bacterium]